MTIKQKNELIEQITAMLEELIDVEPTSPTLAPEPSVDKPLEMLTVKECAALVDGLSEHTVRQLCAQDKIAHVRAGAGRNGKILVSKVSLLKYLGIAG
ncbi:Helix-turn-helix domain-containing protein [Ruminococcus sp. YE71]|uniref:helix-turn-helix domain-containing protein n=1 Tax=unclassified Ruminococcus TaxID=2608920 RepID=UPI000888ECB7|nr:MULTISPECIES: helix-turn-helix domain-containing protein [unclassified Ruminococcus]SDA32063.1 Helix-turn-helix domain-containing protein [Ruminococcus sp. YE78]SFW52641.1 Helix-turn-helix domain-containing protein [Ruminococcus sp. YE71]